VKPAPRWPLHPAPREAEALSSWLNRVALCYHMEVSELLEHDLGHGQVDDLDTAPPLALLAMLSQRSGIELDRLRCMSFAGWVPCLAAHPTDTPRLSALPERSGEPSRTDPASFPRTSSHAAKRVLSQITGGRKPLAECKRWRLYQPSIQSTMSSLACARVS